MHTRQDSEEHPPSRDRSPSYPAISLREAVDRVGMLYETDGKAGAPMDAAFKHIGFGGKNGQSLKVLSALRKYDLVQYVNGRVVPTKLALDILLFGDNDERRKQALRKAALSPTAFSELMEQYRESGLPSNESLQAELVADKGYNRNAVERFLRGFRETLEYAGLASPGVLPSHGGVNDSRNDLGSIAENSNMETDFSYENSGKTKTLVIPLESLTRDSPAFAQLVVPLPLKSEHLARIRTYLDFLAGETTPPK